MTEMDISVLAAVLGRMGGKASKRPPGTLRLILMDVCDEIDSMENRQVFDYWQTFDSSVMADNAELNTCWFKHSLWADPQASNDPGKAYHDSYRALPETWDEVVDGDYVYCYFDGEHELKTDARTIRQTMNNMKKVDKRLTDTGPCED